jgi:hypothetical protein
MVVPEDLKSLASILADWAAPAPGISVHLFGSRVRGDHNPDADVRLHWRSEDRPDRHHRHRRRRRASQGMSVGRPEPSFSRHHHSRDAFRVNALSARRPTNDLPSAIVRHRSHSPLMFSSANCFSARSVRRRRNSKSEVSASRRRLLSTIAIDGAFSGILIQLTNSQAG